METNLNITIAGGTGFLGTFISKKMKEIGYVVKIISRNKGDVNWEITELIYALEKTDVLINLAGKSIDCRFTSKNKQQILDSRINTTKQLNEAVSKCNNPPKVWINASAIGIYKHSSQHTFNEYSTEFATDFLSSIVQQWEQEFYSLDIPQTRKVALRTAVVLGNTGGVFPLLNRLSKLGLGGKQAHGNQMFSWIYIDDYFRILQLIIENETISQNLNASAPTPLRNLELMKSLQKSNHAFLALPSPKFLLKVASYPFNFQPELVLENTNVVSQKLKDLNFKFIAPTIEIALKILQSKK